MSTLKKAEALAICSHPMSSPTKTWQTGHPSQTDTKAKTQLAPCLQQNLIGLQNYIQGWIDYSLFVKWLACSLFRIGTNFLDLWRSNKSKLATLCRRYSRRLFVTAFSESSLAKKDHIR
mmetsp:Transcript_47262/g.111265  ORF Transcript_47262/g.111265 Transcript_47262/m.111265 type:complete len:119 (+) Transcript_47262:851-1207(+)